MGRAWLLMVVIAGLGTFAPSASAQNTPATESIPPGAIVNGNVTIVAEPARLNDADVNRHRAWHEFAEGHPDIVANLARHPALVNDHDYRKKHPDLDRFLAVHPDIREAMTANPGNFVVPVR